MEALEEITKLLSAEQNSGVMTCSAMEEKHFRISTPCLSLKHRKGSFASQNRNQAEEYASALLARPLREPVADGPCEGSISIGRSLLENVYSSLAVLVDCRLHAYVAFLANRISSKEVEHGPDDSDDVKCNRARRESDKLMNLIETGAQVLAKRITTRFEVERDDDDDVYIKGDTCLSMLRLDVSVDLEVPCYHGLSVSFATTGTIKGIFNSEKRLQKVDISLDTHHLLDEMIKQAAHVVSCIVNIATISSCSPASKSKKGLPRSESFLAMPPPMLRPCKTSLNVPKQPQQQKIANLLEKRLNGLDLHSQAASEVPIVSPDISGSHKPAHSIPSFDLQLDDDDAVSHLSVDQCADIIDTCLFDALDEPLSKRARISG